MCNNTKQQIPGKLIVVSAPSGAGKTTLVGAVLNRLNRQNMVLERVITYTTKEPGKSEISGGDYYFVSPEEFQEKINKDFFIEWSHVYGYYYGSPKSFLENLKKGRSYIIIVDRAGWQRIREFPVATTSIWIEPPNLIILEQRLQLRSRDSLLEIKRRLALASQEIQDEQVCPLYHYKIVNDDFDRAIDQLEDIIDIELHMLV